MSWGCAPGKITNRYSLPTTHYALLTTHYPLPTTHYPLRTTRCLPVESSCEYRRSTPSKSWARRHAPMAAAKQWLSGGTWAGLGLGLGLGVAARVRVRIEVVVGGAAPGVASRGRARSPASGGRSARRRSWRPSRPTRRAARRGSPVTIVGAQAVTIGAQAVTTRVEAGCIWWQAATRGVAGCSTWHGRL